MNNIDLLILHGPPGSGKTSIAKSIAEELRKKEVTHAVIDLDDLASIYPFKLKRIMYKNLTAIWPNYTELDIKIIIPTYLQRGELEVVKAAAPSLRTTVSEVTVPTEELRSRVTKRERDTTITKHLYNFIDRYDDNRTEDKYIDFKISNDGVSIEAVAKEIIKKLGW